eukprot:CAMPEP_0180311414 /NCGR_PEP_ID=MMETSP0988-20121125/30240_1 /TAXON_ID=697907 /ORGANISM="non described non described, Strain CCMP2293" /LENGTH=101 /DNA_ID=CAMNT_0022295499 /DNA_START=556 /DNA_END=857 /DNA_ORIENTATION=-
MTFARFWIVIDVHAASPAITRSFGEGGSGWAESCGSSMGGMSETTSTCRPVRPAFTIVLNESPFDVDCPPEEADLTPRGSFNHVRGVSHQDAASEMPRGRT